MTVSHYPDAILVISLLSLWVIFPIGLFLSFSHVDKNTDQIIRLEKLRHMPEEKKESFVRTYPQWAGTIHHTRV
jgi:hypothetical protein